MKPLLSPESPAATFAPGEPPLAAAAPETATMARAIQMVDLRSQYLAIKDEIDAAIHQVIDTTSFIKGPAVAAFERDLAEYLGAETAVGVGNGTDALQIAYMAVGIGPGDEVITTPFSFIATAEAAVLLGARVVFADIDPRTFNIDPDAIEALVTPRTRAIVPVHLFGQPADMDPILDIAARHGIAVIEDNAQGIGSAYRGRRTGALGHLGCFSFFPSKNLGCYGDGGAVVTNDPELGEHVRKIANHGSKRKYLNEIVGVNSRLDSLQAAVLGVKLRRLEAYNEARREAADRYDALLADVPGITVPYRDPLSRHVFHQYTVRIASEGVVNRDTVSARLKECGLPFAVYYPVAMHMLPVFRSLTAEPPALPEAERAAREVLSLPMHTELTPDQQTYIAETLRDVLRF